MASLDVAALTLGEAPTTPGKGASSQDYCFRCKSTYNLQCFSSHKVSLVLESCEEHPGMSKPVLQHRGNFEILVACDVIAIIYKPDTIISSS